MNRDPVSNIAESSPAPTVSIVVRTYEGRAGFLREALDSLDRQAYPNLEVIVVEDGGHTAQGTVDAIADSSQHRFVYRALKKFGRCTAGNFGLEHASGELLGFLDDDDQLLPEHVSTLVETLRQNEAAAAAYAQAWEVPTIVHGTDPLTYTERAGYRVSRPPFSRAALASRNLFPIQAVLFRRRLFETYGGLDERLDNLEDWDLWRRYAAGGDFVAVDRVTSIYRVPGTMRTALARQRTLEAYRSVFDRLHRDDSPTGTLRQRCLRKLHVAARRIAIQSPVFALRWHVRNWTARCEVNEAIRIAGQRDRPAPTATASAKAAS